MYFIKIFYYLHMSAELEWPRRELRPFLVLIMDVA